MVALEIASKINLFLNGIDAGRMYQLMVKHYQVYQLLDAEEKWVHPHLEEISKELLTKDWTEQRSQAFVSQMAELAQKNEYLMHFLELAQNENFEILSEKFKKEGASVIPDIIAYTIVQDRLTVQMKNNPDFIKLLMDIFGPVKRNSNFFKYQNFFHKVKLLTNETGLHKRLKMVKTGVLDPKDRRWLLPINILEAFLYDKIIGSKDNAKAAWPLIVNRPGAAKEEPSTGAGPSIWAPDKKSVSPRMPLPLKWTNLYQTWNMAFVSQSPLFLYLIPKLIIPEVANYHDSPTEYISNRTLTLYLTLFYSGLLVPAKERNKEPIYNWSDKKLTMLWGKINLISADLYKQELLKKREQVKATSNLATA